MLYSLLHDMLSDISTTSRSSGVCAQPVDCTIFWSMNVQRNLTFKTLFCQLLFLPIEVPIIAEWIFFGLHILSILTFTSKKSYGLQFFADIYNFTFLLE